MVVRKHGVVAVKNAATKRTLRTVGKDRKKYEFDGSTTQSTLWGVPHNNNTHDPRMGRD